MVIDKILYNSPGFALSPREIMDKLEGSLNCKESTISNYFKATKRIVVYSLCYFDSYANVLNS